MKRAPRGWHRLTGDIQYFYICARLTRRRGAVLQTLCGRTATVLRDDGGDTMCWRHLAEYRRKGAR